MTEKKIRNFYLSYRRPIAKTFCHYSLISVLTAMENKKRDKQNKIC